MFSVVFAGFSAESLAGRIVDSNPKAVITCSAVKRGPKAIELKTIVDEVGAGWLAGWGWCRGLLWPCRVYRSGWPGRWCSSPGVLCSRWVAWCGLLVLLMGTEGHVLSLALCYLPCAALLSAVVLNPRPLPPLAAICLQALQICDNEEEVHVEHVIVYDHSIAAKRDSVKFNAPRDKWWQDVVPQQSTECPPEWMPAEAPLFKVSQCWGGSFLW